MIPPARWRQWTLLSAPLLALAIGSAPALVPPAMLLWTALGALLLPGYGQTALSPRRPMLPRLVFAGGLMGCMLAGFSRLLPPASSARFLRVLCAWGAGGLAAVGWGRALALPLPARIAWGGGCALGVLCLILCR